MPNADIIAQGRSSYVNNLPVFNLLKCREWYSTTKENSWILFMTRQGRNKPETDNCSSLWCPGWNIFMLWSQLHCLSKNSARCTYVVYPALHLLKDLIICLVKKKKKQASRLSLLCRMSTEQFKEATSMLQSNHINRSLSDWATWQPVTNVKKNGKMFYAMPICGTGGRKVAWSVLLMVLLHSGSCYLLPSRQ